MKFQRHANGSLLVNLLGGSIEGGGLSAAQEMLLLLLHTTYYTL